MDSSDMEETRTMTTSVSLTCSHCGHRGQPDDDVHRHPTYQGGEGIRKIPQCDNLVKCWERWEEKQKKEATS